MLFDTPCNSFNTRCTTKLLLSSFLSLKAFSRNMNEDAPYVWSFKVDPIYSPKGPRYRQFSYLQIATYFCTFWSKVYFSRYLAGSIFFFLSVYCLFSCVIKFIILLCDYLFRLILLWYLIIKKKSKKFNKYVKWKDFPWKIRKINILRYIHVKNHTFAMHSTKDVQWEIIWITIFGCVQVKLLFLMKHARKDFYENNLWKFIS